MSLIKLGNVTKDTAILGSLEIITSCQRTSGAQAELSSAAELLKHLAEEIL